MLHLDPARSRDRPGFLLLFGEARRACQPPGLAFTQNAVDGKHGQRCPDEAKGNGFGYGLKTSDEVARTLSARYYKDGSEILIAQQSGNPRRLTPRECARLMGFDQRSGHTTIIPVSDTRAYKQFGNAVVVPVVEEVARHMKPHIQRIISPGELFKYAVGE